MLFFILIILFTGCNNKSENLTSFTKISSKDEIDIRNYLETNTNDIFINGKMRPYCSFSVLGKDHDKLYLLVAKEMFYKDDKGVKLKTGVYSAMVLFIKNKNGKLIIEKHLIPEDGEYYYSSIKKLFPNNIIDILNKEYNERIKKITQLNLERAKNEIKD